VELSLSAGPRRSELRLWSRIDGPGPSELRLTVASGPVFLVSTRSAAVLPLHWSLASSGRLHDEREFLGHALRWAVERLLWRSPRRWSRRLVRRAAAPIFREVAEGLGRGLDPRVRTTAARFRPDLRATVYALCLRDERGWLGQVAERSPGVLVLGIGLLRSRQTEEAGLQLLGAVKEGRSLERALDAGIRAWSGALGAWSRRRSGLGEAARSAFYVASLLHGEARRTLEAQQRLLVRRAGPWTRPEALLLPPPISLVPEDVPREPRANAAWFEVMKVPRITVPAVDAPALDAWLDAYARFASRHAGALARPPPGITLDAWIEEVALLLQQTERRPSRATDPARVLAALDVAALRNRAPVERVPFVHPGDMAADAVVEPRRSAGEEWGEDGEVPVVERLPPPPRRASSYFAPWRSRQVEILPLTTAGELRAEGARMHNCVGTYHQQVLRGHTSIFSVRVGGKRHTLALIRMGRGWAISEFKGVANRPAGGAELAAIAPWLAEVGVVGHGG
jgi:hypothetical protein